MLLMAGALRDREPVLSGYPSAGSSGAMYQKLLKGFYCGKSFHFIYVMQFPMHSGPGVHIAGLFLLEKSL
jgi:hypothetical protein